MQKMSANSWLLDTIIVLLLVLLGSLITISDSSKMIFLVSLFTFVVLILFLLFKISRPKKKPIKYLDILDEDEDDDEEEDDEVPKKKSFEPAPFSPRSRRKSVK